MRSKFKKFVTEYEHFPLEGMESVVATVSGYHGSERFNLIKLIASTGASYVGNMSPSITHLVCWKFEGRKYELAQKFKTVIVSHRWIEECVKQGRRVLETPYTFQSGQEVGTLCSDISLRINQARVQSKVRKISKEPLLDIGDEEANIDPWSGFTFSNEHNHGSIRPSGNQKRTEKISRKDNPGSSKCQLEAVNSEPMAIEKKRNSTSSKTHCRGRRLVKRQITMVDLASTSEFPQECQVVKELPEASISEIKSYSSKVEMHQNASSRHTTCSGSPVINDDSINVEQIEVVNIDNESDYLHNSPCLRKPSEETCEAALDDHIDNRCAMIQPMPTALSCVICWTDFSPTRGVLPCGHRFCFSCIQNWADQLASQKKPSTCPLCKAGFICITKVEDALFSDQKIYSQTILNDNSKNDVYILPDETDHLPNNPSVHVCFQCSSREPEDLLVRCHYCQIRCVHSYCLDPPLFPWICFQCKDLQMLYLHNRQIVHFN